MQDSQSKTRRRHGADLKAQVLAECAAGTMSVVTMTRLPLHPNNRIEELLPHRWRPGESRG